MEGDNILKHLLDANNTPLWERIRSSRPTDLREEVRTEYMIHLSTSSFTIYIPKGIYRPASFTHELLHADLCLKGLHTSIELRVHLLSHPNLSFLDRELISHVGNCLEHIKMLPVFLSMGYRKEDFISDYHENKMPDDVMRKLEGAYRTSTWHNASAVRLFTGKYFALKACPNMSFSYIKN